MSRQRFLLVFLLVIVPNTWARCADLPALTTLHYGSSYPKIRTWHEQRRIMSRSVAQQRDDAMQMIRARYGNSGLKNLFRNLSGPGKIDFSIPGVETNLRLTTSDNRNVAIGAKRTHLYAAQLHNHSRFRLTGVNQQTSTSLGKTDKDIVFQSRTSKAAGRIEIKELKPTTQRRNLENLKRQIDKMVLARLTGERQIYVNRLPLIPELKKHLSSRGVLAFESVATGRSSTHQPGIRSFAGVLDELDEYERQMLRVKVFRPVARTGLGLGELRGCVINATGRSQLLSRLGRFGGRVVPIASLAVGYFSYRSYQNGEISRREYLMTQSSLAGGTIGGLAGALAGGKAGAAAGLWFGPWGASIGGVFGVVAGGFVGGYAGSAAAEYAIDWHLDFDEVEDTRSFEDFVYEHYRAVRN